MIRSSRIPPLLNRICNDGILSSYLITLDGELLGCSNIHLTNNNNPNNNTLSSPDEANSEHAWENMDPSDIGALVAEVVDDYKRLGLELALLNPSSDKTIVSNGNNGGGGGNNSAGAGDGEGDRKGKDRGRLNCLIVEMEMVRNISMQCMQLQYACKCTTYMESNSNPNRHITQKQSTGISRNFISYIQHLRGSTDGFNGTARFAQDEIDGFGWVCEGCIFTA